MSISHKRKKKELKREADQIVADLVSEIYDQLAAEMVVALYKKKNEVVAKLKTN
jgi:hypothetical protein